MARFIAEIEGKAGMSSRLGTERSGIWSHARGWDLGVEVKGEVNADGDDVFYVEITGGSNHRFRSFTALVIRLNAQGQPEIESYEMPRQPSHALPQADGVPI
jgi:hypothetical protein